ncbi:prephenate dehydratase [Polaribacter sp.]|jgi:prephenate dehydratase|nr:prephenate dehydratase [Polaribacter sp.]MDB9848517.1 prephenate dehydratase [Polaribacter sp.]MDC0086455.1 prephenate dehydratase [Polaribacter sp.]MDC1432588.1 prephenate dehydratase [Polaribacter sp.]
MKVAIQGIKGSNHHIVAKHYFEAPISLEECLSFDSLVDALIAGRSDIGIMALENTIAGSIIPNYALIDANDLHIVGEYYLNIHHHLMGLENQDLSDLEEVLSHPMALLQCKEFFRNHKNIKLVEDADTAAVAKRISEQQLKNVAAIAPKIAADIYGLKIIEDEIQTIKENSTRFVIVQTKPSAIKNKEINKATIKFQLDHKRGSLAAILNVLSDCKMSLTKIQSLPVIETPWKYAFFVDVTFDTIQNYEKAIAIITIMAEEFKVLGTYKSGRE